MFGEDDRARRTAHLEFVAGELRHPDVWLASTADVADWWCRREALRLADGSDGVRITNDGAEAITGVRVTIDRNGAERTLDLPSLVPGATITLAHDGATTMVQSAGAVAATPPRARALPDA